MKADKQQLAANLTRLEPKLRLVLLHGRDEAASRDMARQLVTHGHFVVNGHKVNIPSYRVSPNDLLEVRGGSREMTPFIVAHAEIGDRPVPAWLEVIPSQMRILVHSLPVRGNIDTQVNEQLIVELYSK